jgi:hypothetical protein
VKKDQIGGKKEKGLVDMLQIDGNQLTESKRLRHTCQMLRIPRFWEKIKTKIFLF